MQFDSFVDGGNIASSNSLTYAFNNVGGNILFVGIIGDPSTDAGGVDDVASVTYNGVACTLVGKVTTQVNRCLYLYVLVNPAKGSNNVVITGSAYPHFWCSGAVSYSSARQTGQPDASTAQNGTTGGMTLSVTTIAPSCWTVMVSGGYDGFTPAAGAGSTRRGYDGTYGTWALFDSNGPVPVGSTSMTFTQGGPNGGVMASFAQMTPPTVHPSQSPQIQSTVAR